MPDGLMTVVDPDFERRWSAWQKRGRAHERVIRRRLQIALPGIALFAAIAVLLFR